MSQKPKTVLIVDDDEGMRDTLTAILKRDYRVLRVASGEAALPVLNREDVDIILLDIRLPGISGFEVCKMLRADPATRDLGILMVTALDQPADVERAVEAGTDDFLTKPINKAELLLRLEALLASRAHPFGLERTRVYIDRVQRGGR